MRKVWVVAAALLVAATVWGLDVRVGAGCAVAFARHPDYEEPLQDPPFLFVATGVEILSDESGLVADVAVGWAGAATDGQVTFSFRHSLALDWGLFVPYLQVGIGWAGRFSGSGLTQASLFPEAGAGIEAAMGAFTGQLFAAVRPVPVPLFEADQVPLRRIAVAARVRWTVPQRDRSDLRGRM